MNTTEILKLNKGPIRTEKESYPKLTNENFPKPKTSTTLKTDTQKSSGGSVMPTGKNGFESGNLKVRDAMTSLGFDNDKIGWDGKNVTYNNSYFLTPDENTDGVTKTNANTLISAVNNSYKNSGIDDSVVGVSAYAAGNGSNPYSVTYGEGGVVMIGGIPVENTIIIDGKAYAKRSSVENTLNKAEELSGRKSAGDTVKEYLEKNGDAIESYLDRINNYDEFSYNPENDPAYLAYKEQYMRDAREAYDDAYGLGAARTGGYANSAALTSAAGEYFDHMAELADRIPELAEFAFERYTDNFDMLINGLDLYGTPNDLFLMEYNANHEDQERADAAVAADYDRDSDNREFEYRKFLDEQELESELWERENITIPELMLKMEEAERQEIKDNLSIEKLLADIDGKNIDNEYKSRKYGI